jgi:hypothetical protein
VNFKDVKCAARDVKAPERRESAFFLSGLCNVALEKAMQQWLQAQYGLFKFMTLLLCYKH